MPTNVTPQYQKAEEEYYGAETTEQKIKALKKMLSLAPTHKGAENLRSDIKKRLSKLKYNKEKEDASKKGSQKFSLKREGAAQIVVLGKPNSGKSTLLTKLTNAKIDVAPYEFTTSKPEQGMLNYEGINLQLVEMPAITQGYYDSSNGPLYFSLIRGADLILILLDKRENLSEQKKVILEEFDKAKIRLNKKRPNIRIEKEPGGNIKLLNKENISSSEEKIIEILNQNGVFNATVQFREKCTLKDLKDILDQSVAYRTAIYIENDFSLEDIKNKIWKNLDLIKVFTKQPKKEKDYPPIALEKDSVVRDLAGHVHKDFIKKFKFARVFGKSVKHMGTQVGIEHTLKDGDVVELHLK